MRSAFAKEIVRSITHSLGRFLAIAVIAALGTGFYAGLRMAGPDMRLAADQHFDGTNLYDIRVVSTMGLSDENIKTLEDIEGVEAVMPSCQADVLASVGPDQYTVSLHSLDVEAAQASDSSDGVSAVSDDEEYLNRLILVQGEWPTEPGECVVSEDAVTDREVTVGETITCLEGNSDLDDVLATRELTVVGTVRSPAYVCFTTLGTTSLGSGSIEQYAYVAEGTFAEDYPTTEAFIAVEGAREADASSQAYDDIVAAVEERVEAAVPDIAAERLEGLKAEAQKELDDARAEYEAERADAQAQLDDAQAQLDDAQAQLSDAQSQLSSSLPSLESARTQLGNAASTISSTESQLAAAEDEWRAGSAELESQRSSANAQFADAQAQIDAQRPAVEQGLAQLDTLRSALAGLEAQMAQLDPASEAYAAAAAQYEALEGQIAQIEQGSAQLDAAQAELDAQRQSADAQFADAQAQLDASRAQLDAAWAQLDQGRAEYQSGLSEYQSGMAQYQSGQRSYAEGLAEYEGGKAEFDQQNADAQAQFAEAEQELADAQADIDSLEAPELYVLDRSKNMGAESVMSDSRRIDNIAQVFPAIFFLVAALVSLTTMTRMVDEERVLVGTYKALGYGKGRIAAKYLVYAAVASGVGSLIGIATLSQFLPIFIQYAYSVIYAVPLGPTPVDPGLAVLSAGLGIGVTLAATGFAAYSSLRETPAALMLPRTPKAGKRILLERIRPLWSRLSFSWKVTARNIFRYKRRFFMAVIGIAGCSALLLTGLGLQDAINDIIDKQFYDIYDYHFVVRSSDEATEESQEQVQKTLAESDSVGDFTTVHAENMIASVEGSDDEQRFELVVPSDSEVFKGFVDVRNRESGEALDIGEDGVILAEKLATELGLSVGDTFVIQEEDAIGNATGEKHEFAVTGIMENYVSQYVFMGSHAYEESFGSQLTFTTYYAKTTGDESQRQALSDELLGIDGVKTASFNDETVSTYRTMLRSVDSVVVVLVVAAAALAFVVLYNLTNINISERQREIATLKVLGFTPGEVNAYIFRETVLLSLIGAIVGMPLGIVMEHFVVLTAEVDQVMFGRDIHLTSFVLAFVLTMVFTVVVMLAMRGKLRKIDMVESLKSVE